MLIKTLCVIIAIITAYFLIEDMLLIYAMSQGFISHSVSSFNLSFQGLNIDWLSELWK